MPTVMIVDDEPLVLDLIRRILTEAGYETLTCAGGVAALEFVAERTAPIDVLLTDLKMPDVDGWTVASAVKGRWSSVGVVFMSGYCGIAADGNTYLSLDDCFLQKPFTRATLLSALVRVYGPQDRQVKDAQRTA